MMMLDLISYFLIPLFTALAIPFLGRKNTKITEILSNVTMLAGLINLSIIVFSPIYYGTSYSTFTFDALSVFMLFTIYLVGLCVVFFSSVSDMGQYNKNAFYSLIMISVASMSAMVIAKDFFTMYIFMETLAVTSFALIACEEKANAVEAALKYFLLTFPASALIIIGISLLMIANNSIYFDMVFQNYNVLNVYAVLIIMLGFLIKAGIVPFHFWTPDAYQGSSAVISAHLAGIVTKISGIYAIIRISMLLRNNNIYNLKISSFILLLGIITIIVGAIGALKQKDLKRMLAFSSISQMGYIIAGLATFIPLGIIGAIFHLFNHATFKTVLFLNSASIEKNANTTEMKNLGGLEHNMPWTSWTSIIALFSTAGVPPLSGFWSKIMIIIALWLSGFKISAVIALIFSIITLAYFMIMQKKIFFGQKKEYFNFGEVSIPMLSPVILMSLIIIFAGIFFPYVFDYLKII